MMTSSVSLRLKAFDRNSEPISGRSPSHGVFSIELSRELDSRPPIIMLWPEPSSSVVSARRVVSAGIEVPLIVTAPSDDSCDTSGRTRSEMRPSDRTVGV